MSWIQAYDPQRPEDFAIWQDRENMYWVFWPCVMVGPDVFEIWWWRVARIQPMPTCPRIMKVDVTDFIDEGGVEYPSPEELERAWEDIMRDPTPFMIRQAL